MPDIPASTTLGYVGILLTVVGGFLVLTGLGIIGVENITVQKGKKTWGFGALFAALGLVLILSSEPFGAGSKAPAPAATEPPAASEPAPLALYRQAKNWPLDASEPFDRNDAGWSLEDTAGFGYTREIKNGELIWSYAPKGTQHWFWMVSPFDLYSDFLVSVRARRSGDPGNTTSYGLIFRTQGNKSYFFRIDDSSNFAVQFNDNGQWTDVIGWTKSNAIRVGEFNELTAVADGPQMSFFINQQPVGAVTDTHSNQGNVGLTISTNQVSDRVDFEFDDFEVRVKP